MTFSAQSFSDMVQLLAQHPEWRQELRLLLFPAAEQDALQMIAVLAETQNRCEKRRQRIEAVLEALAEAQRRSEERLTRVEAALERLAEAQQRTEERLGELAVALRQHAGQIGKLRGWHLEYNYRLKTPAYFGSLLKRARVLEHDMLVDELETRLSPGEMQDALLTDLVVIGHPRLRPDLAEVRLAIEVSGVVDRDDVNRARRRAVLLSQVGAPVVAGENITRGGADEAHYHQVVLLQNGRVDYWQEALDKIAPRQENA